MIGRHLAPGLWFSLALAGGFVLLAVFCKGLRPPLILLLFLIGGNLHWQAHKPKAQPFADYLLQRGQIQQEISFKVQASSGPNSYRVQLYELAGHQLSEPMLLVYLQELSIGGSYHTLAEIQPLRDDPILDIHARNYQGIIRPVKTLESMESTDAPTLVFRARKAIQDRLDKALGVYSPLAQALLLSDSDFKREHRQSLNRAGIMHLVVVSGLHVLMLSLFLLVILRAIFPRSLAEAVFMLLLLAFAALNNWAPPITRAMLMIDLALLSRWLSRPLSIAQNLSVSLFVITIVSPAQLFNLGLQLSFTAVALIAFVLPLFRSTKESSGLRSFPRTIWKCMLISLVVSLGIAPLTLYYFGTASLNGVLANLLGLPLIMLLLALSILILIWDIQPFILCFQALTDLWQVWLNLCAKLPLSWEGQWISLPIAMALGLFLLVIVLKVKRSWQAWIKLAIPISLAIAVLLFWPLSLKNQLFIFNSGVSDCSLIFADDGSSMMIDTGGLIGKRAEIDLEAIDQTQSWLQNNLMKWLQRNRVKTLDYLVITHLHGDHAGGIYDLLRSLKVKNLILSDDSIQSELWQETAALLKLQHTKIIAITDTCTINLGSHKVKFLHPDHNFYAPDLNNQSLVCRYDAGHKRFLFTGDIEREAELYLCEHYSQELRAQILKVPHHGSRSSSNPEFLAHVRPQTAIINTAQRNVYGFPHEQAIDRLNEIGAEIRYTYAGSQRFLLKP
ncbi:MAG: DNA internalization-related competence protein ComEC/Rec2 [Candidatus Cloacimonetes bacterium]|nr:DNA internalization-related competence protein ComEC/Rec2 [Candidatus Cloacimonadota bacterium]